jgi:hypothetical protein
MLDEDTLNSLPDLTANTLYRLEVARLPKRSLEEERALAARARQGDNEARQALIENCLPYALGAAYAFYHDRQPLHDDLLDLAQVASEYMVVHFDEALTANEPSAYLRGMANRAILHYCILDLELIKKPHRSKAELEKLAPHFTIESLDTPLYSDDGKRIRLEYFQAPAPQLEQDEQSQRKTNAPLNKAIHQLSKLQQATIVRLYGLFGHPAETPSDIGPAKVVRDRAYKARQKLRVILNEYLAFSHTHTLDALEQALIRDENEPESTTIPREEQEPGRQASANGDEKPALHSEVQNIGNVGGDLPSASRAEQSDPLHGPASDLIEPHWLQQSSVDESTTGPPVDHQLLNKLNHPLGHEQWER